MLDQSFSKDNFRTIFDIQCRKGNYIEDKAFFEVDLFAESREESKKISDINKNIKKEKERLKKEANLSKDTFNVLAYNEFKDSFNDSKKEIVKRKDEILNNVLQKISDAVCAKDFKISIEKGTVISGEQLYITQKRPEFFFVMKQIQYNIKRSFKVKQAERFSILRQLSSLLQDNFPKVVIRTDISKFYESISHKKLLEKITENEILNYPSKKIIKDILNDYWKILLADGKKSTTDDRKGIPRGIAISAYLAELYMKDIDNKIKLLPNVTYYARYVDDIVVIFTPANRNESKSVEEYKNEIIQIVEENGDLSINKDKTKPFDFRKVLNVPKIETLPFLGYNFIFEYKEVEQQDCNKETGELKITKKIEKEKMAIRLSDKKLERYESKIKIAFEQHNIDIKKTIYSKKANRLLMKRIQYLTNNTKLIGRKNNVFVGIYFSNPLLTEPYKDLEKLDNLLREQCKSLQVKDKFIKRLSSLSFVKGFKEKKFSPFNPKEFTNISKIWKNYE